jgi:pilus assembly protein CpaB
MTRRLIAFGIAFVLAVVGTVLVLGYIKTADARAMAGKQAVTVLIAKERISAGTSGAKILSQGLVEEVKMPAETVPKGALGSIGDELDNLVVTADVQASQLLLRGMFGKKVKSTGGLPIPDGKVAVSVQLDAPEQVAGFVRPGTTIAIFGTFNMIDRTHRESNGEGLQLKEGVNQATRVVLPKVEVLAIGAYGQPGTKTSDGKTTATTSDSRPGQASKVSTLVVTVAVTSEEATRLVHALQTSSLYLALVTDSSDVESGAGVDNHTLYN